MADPSRDQPAASDPFQSFTQRLLKPLWSVRAALIPDTRTFKCAVPELSISSLKLSITNEIVAPVVNMRITAFKVYHEIQFTCFSAQPDSVSRQLACPCYLRIRFNHSVEIRDEGFAVRGRNAFASSQNGKAMKLWTGLGGRNYPSAWRRRGRVGIESNHFEHGCTSEIDGGVRL